MQQGRPVAGFFIIRSLHSLMTLGFKRTIPARLKDRRVSLIWSIATRKMRFKSFRTSPGVKVHLYPKSSFAALAISRVDAFSRALLAFASRHNWHGDFFVVADLLTLGGDFIAVDVCRGFTAESIQRNLTCYGNEYAGLFREWLNNLADKKGDGIMMITMMMGLTTMTFMTGMMLMKHPKQIPKQNQKSVCLSACMSVCPSLSVCLPVCLHVCLYVCLSDCRPVCLLACLSVCLSVCLHVCLPVCLLACLPPSLSFCLSVCPSICLSVWSV